MKVRCDFVSNSSSCSFIIGAKYVRKACETTYRKLNSLEVPYDIDQDITIRIYAKNKNVDALYSWLYSIDDMSSNEKPQHYDGEDPEDCSFDSTSFTVGQFIELANKLADDEKTCSLIDHIMFESDDYGSGPINLLDFYDFFDKNRCKPNAHDSEHEFMCEDESDFRSVLKGKTR